MKLTQTAGKRARANHDWFWSLLLIGGEIGATFSSQCFGIGLQIIVLVGLRITGLCCSPVSVGISGLFSETRSGLKVEWQVYLTQR